EPEAVSNVAEFSVSEISNALKRTLEDTFGHVRVRGELGRVSRPASGHVYLDLKDDRAVISGVIWKGTASRMNIQPEQGLEVIATGRITTFPGQSKYQIIIETLEPAGAGALMALLEERRKKLSAEGLFDEDRKRELSYLPTVIGVVTSPTGAVIRDILHRLSDRFPRHVLVWPVRVQGESSAKEVANGIRGFNAFDPGGEIPRPDLIIVARGGGSLEDLWGFNEEEVVRAAADSTIPLISAVGHETDWTLIDHAADWRAPTPTAAAERAVPVRSELLAYVADMGARQHRAVTRAMDERRTRITAAGRGLPRPDDLLALARQRFDAASGRLGQSLKAATAASRSRFDRVAGRLTVKPLLQQISRDRETVIRLSRDARRSLDARMEQRRQSLSAADKLLRAFSYQAVLERGFALVRDGDGQPVRTVAATSAGMGVSIEFADGQADAVIGVKGTKKSGSSVKSSGGGKPGGGQGSLF
ncbi:MAG: exodeoxyribonuclease VII large subunit, partial [Anderseniella sp.]